MSIIEAIIIGIIQGLTEFLPISSTAHMTLFGDLMGLIDHQNPESWTAFIATVQLGTLASVLIYFWKDLVLIMGDFLKFNIGSSRVEYKKQSFNSKLAWYVIIGTIPIVTIGLLLKKIIEGDATKSPIVIAISLMFFALILFISDRKNKQEREFEKIRMIDSIIMGLMQCLALIPGASRSGTTMTGGFFRNLKRDAAARFSFLLSIPAVLASGLLEFYKSIQYLTSDNLFMLIVSIIVAFIVGYISIGFLLKYLKTNSTFLFVVYRIILGLGILLYFV